MYEIGQVIFIVMKKDDLVIIPVQVVSLATTKELAQNGTIQTNVTYKVAHGQKVFSLDKIKGSQFSTIDDAVDGLRRMWEQKLKDLRTKALAVAAQAFNYEYKSTQPDADLDITLPSAEVVQPAESSAPVDTHVQPMLPGDPNEPKMNIDMSSIEAAFAK
jgi:hypothetical protein